MYKVNFKNSRGLNLVGIFYPANSKSIILITHGFTGDKSEWGRFDKAAEALNKEGYNILTFDFSGSGESDDDFLSVGKQVDDLNCAIKFVLDKGLRNIGLIGLSLGGLVSAKVYDKRIKAMVFWAPVTNARKNYERRFTKRQINELHKKGFITYNMNKGVRKVIMIDKQMIIDRESVDQAKLLSHIGCPVLIIHGSKDNTVPIKDSESSMNYLSAESKLEIIEGADHGFYEYLDKFIEPTVRWFRKYL